MRRTARGAIGAAILALAAPARAHHGVAAVGGAGPEGPGAAMETTSPLPLARGAFFAMARTEYVPFQRREPTGPGAKSYFSFSTLALGYGLRPWLSVYAFQPLSVKDQAGVGRNAGAGDTNLMLSLALKWDGGLRLVPERESLDDLADWHFGVAVASTLPVGPTAARAPGGGYFSPDMQTGFGAPSPTVGVTVLKQLARDLTWLAEASYQHFFPHTYRFARYRFGGEARLNTAAVWRAWGAGRLRLDVSGELNGLRLERDRERNEAGEAVPLQASGGAIVYAGAGVRASRGPLSIALGVRRAALRRLNEEADQQGSEGLERFRATLAVGGSTGF